MDTLEKLAELEHEQWVEWSKALVIDETISKGRIDRWKSYWVPYNDLADHVKEHDRVWARKVLGIVQNSKDI